MSETDANARLDALEVRITYQDKVIEDLNNVVTAQWRQIDALTKQLERMTDRLRSVEESVPPSGEPEPPPPHY
jgi:SlyX protein